MEGFLAIGFALQKLNHFNWVNVLEFNQVWTTPQYCVGYYLHDSDAGDNFDDGDNFGDNDNFRDGDNFGGDDNFDDGDNFCAGDNFDDGDKFGDDDINHQPNHQLEQWEANMQ